MNFKDTMRGLGRPRSMGEALTAIKAEKGKHASRDLADRLGISMRQAQRYLKGEIKRPPAEREQKIRASADRRVVAASALRQASTISLGTVEVEASPGSKGSRTSTRRLPLLIVDGEMRAQLEEAADLFAAGDEERAEAKLSEAIMGGYSRSSGDNRHIAPGALKVTDYRHGITTS